MRQACVRFAVTSSTTNVIVSDVACSLLRGLLNIFVFLREQNFPASVALWALVCVCVCVLSLHPFHIFRFRCELGAPDGWMYRIYLLFYDECKLRSVRCMFVICALFWSCSEWVDAGCVSVRSGSTALSKHTFPCLNRLTFTESEWERVTEWKKSTRVQISSVLRYCCCGGGTQINGIFKFVFQRVTLFAPRRQYTGVASLISK